MSLSPTKTCKTMALSGTRHITMISGSMEVEAKKEENFLEFTRITHLL